MGKVDPKVKNFFKFFVPRIIGLGATIYLLVKYVDSDLIRLCGWTTIAIIIWRTALSMYRRLVQPSKHPRSYGKWAIVTGSTSGIGKDFANYLVDEGMSVVVISRTEEKLKAQLDELKALESYIAYAAKGEKLSVDYLTYDFAKVDAESRKDFYERLQNKLTMLDQDGGIGLLVNNVGTANEYPMNLMEMSDDLIENIINVNILSVTGMTRAVLPFMEKKGKGAVLSISSGSGNYPSPMLSIYSATKAFMTQFSRSLSIEYWDKKDIDFMVVTPFYVVSNLYKRKTGTFLAPMPLTLIKGTMSQLGKKYIWQGHGYWFHGFLNNVGAYYWGAVARNKKMMEDNRRRYDEKQNLATEKKER